MEKEKEHEPWEDYCEPCEGPHQSEEQEYDWDDDAWDVIY